MQTLALRTQKPASITPSAGDLTPLSSTVLTRCHFTREITDENFSACTRSPITANSLSLQDHEVTPSESWGIRHIWTNAAALLIRRLRRERSAMAEFVRRVLDARPSLKPADCRDGLRGSSSDDTHRCVTASVRFGMKWRLQIGNQRSVVSPSVLEFCRTTLVSDPEHAAKQD